MKLLNMYYDVEIRLDSPVQNHIFLLRAFPASRQGQTVLSTSMLITPQTHPENTFSDGFGNRLCVGSIEHAHDLFRYTVTASVFRDDEAGRAKGEVFTLPAYGYASPLTNLSEDMAGTVERMKERGQLPADRGELCGYLSHYVHEQMQYVPGATTIDTTAAEAWAQKEGVCQDYAHVLLALLRAFGVPARYVSGVTMGYGETHAWVEYWTPFPGEEEKLLGQRGFWTGLDPTRDQAVDESYLSFCVGRDFADCPLERGVFLGTAHQQQSVYSQVLEH